MAHFVRSCLAAIVLAFVVTAVCAQNGVRNEAPAALRDLPADRDYEIRTLYLEDARLPTLDASQRSELYRKLERLLQEWYGYRVVLRDLGKRGIEEYFAGESVHFTRNAARIRNLDLNAADPADENRIRAAIAMDLLFRELSQIESYFGGTALTSKSDAVERALRQFQRLNGEIRAITLPDGGRFQTAATARFNSFAHWEALLTHAREADFIITNSVIAGADTAMPIYVVARGGVTGGVTCNNPHNTYQSAAMVGLFPFLSNAPFFQRERGEIPPKEMLDVIATFTMHEFGHLFLRVAEYYDHPHCVHVSPRGFTYLPWHRAIRAQGPCKLPHRKLDRF